MPDYEVRTYCHSGKWYFDIVDNSDVIDGLPELVHSDGKPFAKETTAHRNGIKWVKSHA